MSWTITYIDYNDLFNRVVDDLINSQGLLTNTASSYSDITDIYNEMNSYYGYTMSDIYVEFRNMWLSTVDGVKLVSVYNGTTFSSSPLPADIPQEPAPSGLAELQFSLEFVPFDDVDLDQFWKNKINIVNNLWSGIFGLNGDNKGITKIKLNNPSDLLHNKIGAHELIFKSNSWNFNANKPVHGLLGINGQDMFLKSANTKWLTDVSMQVGVPSNNVLDGTFVKLPVAITYAASNGSDVDNAIPNTGLSNESIPQTLYAVMGRVQFHKLSGSDLSGVLRVFDDKLEDITEKITGNVVPPWIIGY